MDSYLEITEKEMIERLIDGLKRAASRADEFVKSPEKDRPKIFLDFIESMKVAAGSSHQLGVAQENPKFLDVRDLLENIITLSYTLPQRFDQADPLWDRVKTFLENIAESARKLATMQAMTRTDVVAHMNHRAKVMDLN